MAKTDDTGRLHVTVAPLQFALWRAERPLAAVSAARVTITAPAARETLVFTAQENDGLVFPSRREVRVEVAGGDAVGEVTFTLTRSSRPDQVEYLGTDDAAPYRIFWSPPADLAPGDTLEFTATYDDLRRHRASASVEGVQVRADGHVPFGIAGATVPRITRQPAASRGAGGITLAAAAGGTAPLEYQWLRDGAEIPGATAATLKLEPAAAGDYRVLVRNLAGTAISASLKVESVPAAPAAGR
jgi:alpha-amylase